VWLCKGDSFHEIFIYTEMSIPVCGRMDDCVVAVFTLMLPLITLAFSLILKTDSNLRKEMEYLEEMCAYAN